MKKTRVFKERNRAELILMLPEFLVFRIKAADLEIGKRSTKIRINDVIDEVSMSNLQNAVSYLENDKETEVVMIARVKTRKINCNYLKLIIEKRSQSLLKTNQLNVVCEWIT